MEDRMPHREVRGGVGEVIEIGEGLDRGIVVVVLDRDLGRALDPDRVLGRNLDHEIAVIVVVIGTREAEVEALRNRKTTTEENLGAHRPIRRVVPNLARAPDPKVHKLWRVSHLPFDLSFCTDVGKPSRGRIFLT